MKAATRSAIRVRLSMVLLLTLATAGLADAQNGQTDQTDRANFYRVYQYETPEAGWFEPTFWTTHVAKSNGTYDDFHQTLGRAGLTAWSGELEYGVTDHLSLATYFDVQDPHGKGPQFTQGRIEARYHFLDSYDLPVNLAVYGEYYIPRKGYNRSQEMEFRLIAEKDYEDFRLDLNPVLEVSTTGPEAGSAPRLGFDASLAWRRYFRVQPALEYYSNYGDITHPASASDQQQLIFPTADVHLGRNLDWQVGVGFGLTHASDSTVVKSILTYEFQGINPQRLFGRRGR